MAILKENEASLAAIRARLVERLVNYRNASLPSTQRLFLMKRMPELVPDDSPFPTLAAEDLAAEFIAAHH